MKKFTLKNLAAAAALLFAGNAMAVEVISLDCSKSNGFPTTADKTNEKDVVIDNNTWSFLNTKQNSGYLMISQGGYITLPAFDFVIDSISVTINKGASASLKVALSVNGSNSNLEEKAIDAYSAQKTAMFVLADKDKGAGIRYKLTSTNKNAQYKNITIYGTTAETPENICKTPEFSIISGSYIEEQTIEITCETEGATIYYTTDETDPTAESTAYDAANPLKVSESVVIKAIAIKEGMENSAIKTLSLTFPTVVENIAGFIAAQTDELCRIAGAVSVAWGDAKNLYICDNSGSLLVYSQAGTNPTLNNGDVLTGIVGTKSMYNDAAQMVPSLIPDAVAGEAVAPSVKTLAEITTDMVHQYIQIEEVTFKAAASFNASKASNATAVEEDLEMTIRNNFLLVANLVTDKTYKVTGFVSVFQNAPQIYPTEIVENEGTAIEGVEAAAVNVTAYAGNIYVAGNGEAVEVYNIAGAKVADGVANGSAIAVNAKGVMIVKAGSTVVKAIVK